MVLYWQTKSERSCSLVQMVFGTRLSHLFYKVTRLDHSVNFCEGKELEQANHNLGASGVYQQELDALTWLGFLF